MGVEENMGWMKIEIEKKVFEIRQTKFRGTQNELKNLKIEI